MNKTPKTVATYKGKNYFVWDHKKQQEKNLIRWIEALISGDYQQGQCSLYNRVTGRHCVNGVAAEVVGHFKWRPWSYLRLPFGLGCIELSKGGYYFGFEADNWKSLRSNSDVPYTWFYETFGPIKRPAFWDKLNNSGKSFAEIAAILVTYLPSSERRTELSLIIADKLADERTARQNMEKPDWLKMPKDFPFPQT